MIKQTPKELFEKGLLTEKQFNHIEPIISGKIVSVFYELRTLLYLGVMLLTTGMGILIYENIGEMGHLIAIIMLAVFTIVSFWYVFRNALDYSNDKVDTPTPYFQYVLLLGALLFISVQGYLQFQYGTFDDGLGLSTLITAAFFFYLAYRFDHLGVLSLAITALASFWSISVSPQKWYSDDFFSDSGLHNVALVFGSVLASIALLLDKRSIKKHFTFTYLNFGTMIFFGGAVTGMFEYEQWFFLYLLLIYAGCVFAYYIARLKKSFLFLIYAFVSAYIGTTYLLAETVLHDAVEIWFLYSMLSCGGFIYFIITYKNHFNQQR